MLTLSLQTDSHHKLKLDDEEHLAADYLQSATALAKSRRPVTRTDGRDEAGLQRQATTHYLRRSACR